MATPDDFDLQRQIDKLEAKVDKVDFKVESGFGGLNELLGEKLGKVEQRIDLTSKQQQQAIELLISAQSANETQVNMVDRDLTKLRADHTALEDKVASIQASLTWTVRTLAGTAIATIATLVVSLIK